MIYKQVEVIHSLSHRSRLCRRVDGSRLAGVALSESHALVEHVEAKRVVLHRRVTESERSFALSVQMVPDAALARSGDRGFLLYPGPAPCTYVQSDGSGAEGAQHRLQALHSAGKHTFTRSQDRRGSRAIM